MDGACYGGVDVDMIKPAACKGHPSGMVSIQCKDVHVQYVNNHVTTSKILETAEDFSWNTLETFSL